MNVLAAGHSPILEGGLETCPLFFTHSRPHLLVITIDLLSFFHLSFFLSMLETLRAQGSGQADFLLNCGPFSHKLFKGSQCPRSYRITIDFWGSQNLNALCRQRLTGQWQHLGGHQLWSVLSHVGWKEGQDLAPQEYLWQRVTHHLLCLP